MTEHQSALGTVGELSDRMLYQPVTYQAGDGSWHRDFLDAVRRTDRPLSWDPAAVQSILSHNFACGDRTLFREIQRKPWLSSIASDGQPQLLAVPRHGRRGQAPEALADHLGRLLEDEIVRAAQGHEQVMLLLSGGLDSRIIAGIAARARGNGRITVPLAGVTWGQPDSRDVVYAEATANLLGLEWIHLDLEPEHVIENIELAASDLGAIVSPIDLHRMAWLENAGRNTVVVGASYGDGLGRAEYLYRHILQLRRLTPGTARGLLTAEALTAGREGFRADLAQLQQRAPAEPRYALCELEMQVNYLRSKLAHVMDVINRHCTLYQAFTHPSVYEYIWSLHPAFRTEQIYAALLRGLGPDLAALPWERTNRALIGPTRGAVSGLRTSYHDYERWISGELFQRLHDELDIRFLASTGMFDPDRIGPFLTGIHRRTGHTGDYHSLLWLLSVQRLVGRLHALGVTVEPFRASRARPQAKTTRESRLRGRLTRSRPTVRALRLVRSWKRPLVFRRSLREFPPE